ncbi:preprotein translocase subunit SecA [Stieleria sp. TO1_6]|uniref:preprotein translocase subunit SecA n=1 Tax=Stieleria tagensis TaxID=2956795 RepID=UPI00209ABC1D|nr:preprotein translocase subunit SecA [Stieleria tagensis]MCO8121860.1 preprotein translocase subunit SecA [Stieleria tagensis]
MFPSRATIASYRSLGGRPCRGVQSITPTTQTWIANVRRRWAELGPTSDGGLRELAAALRARIIADSPLRAIPQVVESFALTAEALRRTHGIDYYDVQLAGGFALAAGTIAEIETGEGKTITAALPAVLFAWSARGVHVATTNEYLSQRDHDYLAPVYQKLGLSVGILQSAAAPAAKVQAYAADITYGPGYEFGFDFLRDQLALRNAHQQRLGDRLLRRLQGDDSQHVTVMQREPAFAIIDEADSVLIDQAGTPLILCGEKCQRVTSPALYAFARSVALQLTAAADYVHDDVKRIIGLTATGRQRIQSMYADRPAGQLARSWKQLIENALRSEFVLHRERDYVVHDDRVLIVDQQTGRIHDQRKWSGGLHQAVETKEQVSLSDENETQARITRQRYIGFYDTVAGLTGTAADSQAELREFYRLPVVRIPTHKPNARQSLPLRCFDSQANKLSAIVTDTLIRHRRGQPVLIGASTIEESVQMSERLKQHAVAHVVLNGLQDQSEADIVSLAGTSGAVTVATNMAGRGTDIQPDDDAIAAGGLHVVATQLSACRRVDRQLVGRAARQGEPGSCQIYVAAEDELIRTRAPDLAARIRAAAGPTGECDQDFSAPLRRVQSQAESSAQQQRRQLVAHDDWIESLQSTLARRA